jgi:RNA polymerase sigma-70 factor (ECF subfamily)
MFPETRYSAVALAASDDPDLRAQSIAKLAAIYYRPIYLHLRRKWRLDEAAAQDAAQAFFALVLERNVFAAYRLERGRFRTFVRACLDHLVHGELRTMQRLKRGGGQQFVAMDAAELERDLARYSDGEDDDIFDREFVRSLFASAVTALRQRLEAANKGHYVTLFEAYDLCEDPDQRPTYAQLAKQAGLEVTDVTNYLYFARKEFRRCVAATLRDLTSSEEEAREEAAELGIDLDRVG